MAATTLGFAILMNLLISGLSYASLGDDVKETLLFNLDETLWYNDIVLFGYTVAIFLTIPIMGIPILNVVSNNETINSIIG